MKTPITYYGGKQQLSGKILKLIPDHRIYCEPFIGGGAVFFRKATSEVEIINDINGEIVNFYEVLQRDFSALASEVSISMHSRRQHKHARVIYENPEMFDRVKRAWAVWVLANESFGSKFGGGWGYDVSGTTTKKIVNKKDMFTDDLAIRLQRVQIECCDALRIIRSRDTSETFYYLDPPYPDTDQGHYDGYSPEDFKNLLETVCRLEGKFLLSSFRHKYLDEYTAKYGWYQIELRMAKPMTVHTGKVTQKIEVLTANYPIKIEEK